MSDFFSSETTCSARSEGASASLFACAIFSASSVVVFLLCKAVRPCRGAGKSCAEALQAQAIRSNRVARMVVVLNVRTRSSEPRRWWFSCSARRSDLAEVPVSPVQKRSRRRPSGATGSREWLLFSTYALDLSRLDRQAWRRTPQEPTAQFDHYSVKVE